ncbi:MAG: murein biosynthesis integral membrane protein MurJ [Fibrobacterota bacterium]
MRQLKTKGTFTAILILFVSNFLSRIIGFVRTQVQAGFIGTGSAADAYAISFLLPDTLNYILAGGVLSVTFIPIFQELKQNNPAQCDRFFSNLLTTGTLLFALSIIAGTFFTPDLINFLSGKNITGEERLLSIRLTRIILPAQLFFFWGALLKGVQFADKKFLIPSLAPVIYNIGIITGGVLLYEKIGVTGFSLGVVVGAFLGNVAVQIPAVRKSGITYHPVVDLKDPALHRWFVKTLPLVIGLGFTFSNNFLIRTFGSRCSDGAGAVSALDYAYRLFMVLVGLLGQSVAAGVYPFITQMANENRIDRIEETVLPLLNKVGALLISVSLIVPFISTELVSLLFERAAFDSSSTEITARALTAYIPGLFFFTAVLILNRLYYAVQRMFTPTIISTVSVLISLPLFFILSSRMGVTGVALPASLFSVIAFTAMIIHWKHLYSESRILTIFPQILRVIILSLPGGISAALLSRLSYSGPFSTVWMLFTAGLLPFCLNLFIFDRTGILPMPDLTKKFRKK